MQDHHSTVIIPKILVGVFLSVFLITPLSLTAATNGEDIVRKLEQTFAGIHALKASFKQEADISIAGIERQEESTGMFYLKKPDKIKWVYEQPEKEILLLQNELLYFYSEQDNQLLKRRVTSLKDSANYLALLLNPDNSLLSHYSLEKISKKGNIFEATLTPKANEDTIKSLTLFIRTKDFQLTGLRFSDNLENTTQITFENMEVNPVLANDLFTLQVPVGTDIVDFNNDN